MVNKLLTKFTEDVKMKSIKKNYLKINNEGKIDRFEAKKEVKEKKNKESVLVYFNVGYYLVTPILFGIGAGILVDKWINTKPVFTILLLLIGTIGSFYNLFTIQKK